MNNFNFGGCRRCSNTDAPEELIESSKPMLKTEIKRPLFLKYGQTSVE